MARRIALSYVGLIALLLLALGIYLAELLRGQYLAGLEERLRREARLVSVGAREPMARGDLGALRAMVAEWREAGGTRVTIVALDGTVLDDSEADPATMENHGSRPEVAEALAGRVGQGQRLSVTRQVETAYLAVPIEAGGGVLGAARVAVPVGSIQQATNQLLAAVASALAASALLASLLAAVLARATVGRLTRITRAADQLARGRLSVRVPDTGGDEVGDLGTAFNRMAAALRTQIDAVQRERGRLEDVVRFMADGLVIADEWGEVRLINRAAARLLRVDQGRAVGRSVIATLRDHELAEMARSALRQTAPIPARLLELGGGASRASVLVSVGVIPSSEPAGGRQVLMVLRDVTELRRTEQVRREFAANVSHELRTPVASLKALVETLEGGALEDPEEGPRFLDHMHREVDRLAGLVTELLELSRIESGQVPLRFESVDAAAVIDGAVERLRPQANRAGVELAVDVPGGLPAVRADAERLEQVITSLLHNALKFTPSGGRVAVSAEWLAPVVQVAVADNGIGIAPEHLGRLFERFFKADRSRSAGGTGLGLAIAKHIVEAHGGGIWAHSPGEGRGATFTFTLPVAQAGPTTGQPPLAPGRATG